MVGLVGGAVYLGWMYATWKPSAPEPRGKTTTIKIPSGEQARVRPETSASTEISGGRFEITLPIPTSLPTSKPEDKEPVEPARPVVKAEAEPKVGPSGVLESDLQGVMEKSVDAAPEKPAAEPGQEPAKKPAEESGPALAELQKPLTIGDLTIPPPSAVPPFERGEKPVFVLETELQGETVAVRGRTNLAVDGNGVQVSLFRVFKEANDGEARRASLETRSLPLSFEGSFKVDDQKWLRARQENERENPGVFPALSYLDRERVQVEVLFTGTRKDLGPVPGMTVYPIPGTDKQVYRIIRSVSLPITRPAPEPTPAPAPTPAREVGKEREAEEKAPPPKPLRKPRGPTRIKISPLKWVDGPVQASRPGPAVGPGPGDGTAGESFIALAPLVLAYRF